MNTIGFETCDIQGRESILVVDHDKKKVLEVLDTGALGEWLEKKVVVGAPGEWLEEKVIAGAPGEHEQAGGSTVVGECLGEPRYVWVDLVPAQLETLKTAFPEAAFRIYLNSIPHLVGAEELRRLEAEYGNVEKNQSAQRHLGAVRYAFDERQLSIAAGKLTLRFVTQDLRLSADKIERLNKLFDFCQGFLLPDPTVDDAVLRDKMLREHVDAFLEGPEAATIPETAALIREYKELICPAGTPVACAPYHLVKDTWLNQVERGDEETPVSYEEVVEKILAFSVEED